MHPSIAHAVVHGGAHIFLRRRATKPCTKAARTGRDKSKVRHVLCGLLPFTCGKPYYRSPPYFLSPPLLNTASPFPVLAIFMQDAVVDMDPISLIITSLDVKEAFPNTPHLLLRAVWEHMGLPFQGLLQAYLATSMYAIRIDVGTTPWVQPASGFLQGDAEGPFLFLLVTLLLALYIRRTYPDVAPYPLRTTLLVFADDMAVVTATARQPLSTTPDPTRAAEVLHVVTTYLKGNQLLVHNVKSATMVHNAP